MQLYNEPELYLLIINSQMPLGEKFQVWVFEDILPSIRKQGEYKIKEKYINEVNYLNQIAHISSELVNEESSLVNTQYNFIESLKPSVVPQTYNKICFS